MGGRNETHFGEKQEHKINQRPFGVMFKTFPWCGLPRVAEITHHVTWGYKWLDVKQDKSDFLQFCHWSDLSCYLARKLYIWDMKISYSRQKVQKQQLENTDRWKAVVQIYPQDVNACHESSNFRMLLLSTWLKDQVQIHLIKQLTSPSIHSFIYSFIYSRE